MNEGSYLAAALQAKRRQQQEHVERARHETAAAAAAAAALLQPASPKHTWAHQQGAPAEGGGGKAWKPAPPPQAAAAPVVPVSIGSYAQPFKDQQLVGKQQQQQRKLQAAAERTYRSPNAESRICGDQGGSIASHSGCVSPALNATITGSIPAAAAQSSRYKGGPAQGPNALAAGPDPAAAAVPGRAKHRASPALSPPTAPQPLQQQHVAASSGRDEVCTGGKWAQSQPSAAGAGASPKPRAPTAAAAAFGGSSRPKSPKLKATPGADAAAAAAEQQGWAVPAGVVLQGLQGVAAATAAGGGGGGGLVTSAGPSRIPTAPPSRIPTAPTSPTSCYRPNAALQGVAAAAAGKADQGPATHRGLSGLAASGSFDSSLSGSDYDFLERGEDIGGNAGDQLQPALGGVRTATAEPPPQPAAAAGAVQSETCRGVTSMWSAVHAAAAAAVAAVSKSPQGGVGSSASGGVGGDGPNHLVGAVGGPVARSKKSSPAVAFGRKLNTKVTAGSAVAAAAGPRDAAGGGGGADAPKQHQGPTQASSGTSSSTSFGGRKGAQEQQGDQHSGRKMNAAAALKEAVKSLMGLPGRYRLLEHVLAAGLVFRLGSCPTACAESV